MKDSFENQTLAGIVSQYPVTARIFEQHGLDYCCQGKQRLQEACHRQELPVEQLCGELEALLQEQEAASAWNPAGLAVPELINHIISRHHQYVREAVPVLMSRLERIAAKHGERFPNMIAVKDLFGDLADELLGHMIKEERILFPMLLSQYRQYGQCQPAQVSGPIQVMEEEHERAASLLEEIKRLTNQYEAPPQACQTFRLTLAGLQEFEEDLHQHVHLENNVLFVSAE